MTLDSKSGQTHNQYRIKQPITNLYTSLLLQKYTITETKVQGASLYFRTGVRLTMHVTGLSYALWDEEFFMEFTIHGLLGLHACWWIISESILLATTIQSILQHILKRIPLLIFYTRDYVRDHKTTKKKKGSMSNVSQYLFSIYAVQNLKVIPEHPLLIAGTRLEK